MKYTFSQAKQKLAPYAGAYAAMDLGDAINVAMEELSKSEVWNQQTQLATFTTVNEYFSIPQEFDHIIRAAVNNTPVSIRRTDYEFLHGGPGNLDSIPAGFAPANGLQVLGNSFPTMYAPDRGMALAAFSTSVPSGYLTVRGNDANGDVITASVPVNVWGAPSEITSIGPDTVSKTTEDFYSVSSVVLPQDAVSHITLVGVADGEFYFLSRMHPGLRVPEFARYRLPGFSDEKGASYEVMCEVSRRFIPLVDDDDVVPFDSLLPVQYMMKSLQYLETNEVDAGMKYHTLAMEMMGKREAQSDKAQGLVVENQVYSSSPGYMSNYDFNNL